VPKNYHAEVVDEVRTVRDDDAWRTKLLLARREGLLVGISAGANVLAALAVAAELGAGKNVVTVLPDTGERYFSLDTFFPDVQIDDPPGSVAVRGKPRKGAGS
jgi:cysteine synthase A